jgi:hypothetical protein
MTIKRGAGYVEVVPGDPVPEAETWENVKSWERSGFIRHLDRPTGSPGSAKVDEKKTERADLTPPGGVVAAVKAEVDGQTEAEEAGLFGKKKKKKRG